MAHGKGMERIGSAPILRQVGWSSVDIADPKLLWTGRLDGRHPVFSWTGSQLRLRFLGKGVRFHFAPASGIRMAGVHRNFYNLLIDGDTSCHPVSGEEREIAVEELPEGEHEVVLDKATEALCGGDRLTDVELLDGQLLPSSRLSRTLLFLGNSITAGYGVEAEDPKETFSPETQNGMDSYAGVCARLLGAERIQICISGKGLVRNFDGSAELTVPKFRASTAPQDSRPWSGKEDPDAVVVEVGTNDFYLGDPGQLPFVLTYQSLVKDLLVRYPRAKIVLLDSPMLTNDFPIDTATDRPVASFSQLRFYLDQIPMGFSGAQRERISVFQQSQQSEEVLGTGADNHPNRAQAQLNGEELADHLRKILGW
jgi:lysophospholipase L1-like esterase